MATISMKSLDGLAVARSHGHADGSRSSSSKAGSFFEQIEGFNQTVKALFLGVGCCFVSTPTRGDCADFAG